MEDRRCASGASSGRLWRQRRPLHLLSVSWLASSAQRINGISGEPTEASASVPPVTPLQAEGPAYAACPPVALRLDKHTANTTANNSHFVFRIFHAHDKTTHSCDSCITNNVYTSMRPCTLYTQRLRQNVKKKNYCALW